MRWLLRVAFVLFCVAAVRAAEEPAAETSDEVVHRWLAADGVPATELRLADLRNLLADEGVHHVLTLRRGDGTVAVELTVTLVSLDEN